MDTKYIIGKDYKKNKIRTKKYDDGVLLTNDYGKWCFISKNEYEKFLFGDLSKELFKKLEDSFMILTDENNKKISHQINDFYWHIGKGTTLHILVPTLRCNFTCKYCYAFRAPEDDKDKDMTPEVLDQTIDFIFDTPSDTYSIEFTGGEPLLRFDLVKRGIERAIKLAREKNKKLMFSVVTNGTYLTQEMIDYFYDRKVGLCLSIDGPKELHDDNRKFTKKGCGTYDDVIKALDLLKKNNYGSINALPVIVKNSLNFWKEIVDEYIKLGFNTLRFKFVSRFGFALKAWEQMCYTPDEFLDTWKKVINYMIELNKKGVEITENIATMMVFKIKEQLDAGYAEMQIPCGAVIGQVVYDYDGAIYTCDEGRTMPEFKVGDVFTSNYRDLLNCPVTKTLQSVSNLNASCDECSWYTFCGVCPLEIYTEENGFITNIPSNYRCKMHMGMYNFIFDKILHDKEAKKILFKWPYLKRTLKDIPDLNKPSPVDDVLFKSPNYNEQVEESRNNITQVKNDI
jgi:uncharacterized protein